jgi:hypothetical protein
MDSFGISKFVAGGRPTWLTRSFPFLIWGSEVNAARYLTEAEAWRVIGRLSHLEGSGAVVHALAGPVPGAD